MSEIRINLDEVRQFLKSLETIDNVIAPKARRLMRMSVDTMEAEVVGRTPVGATGNLRGGIATEIYGQRLDLRGEVSSALPYSEVAERGRRPGKAPLDYVGTGPRGGKIFEAKPEITYWVERKGIASGEDAKYIARLIALAIGAHGTEGAHMFEEGFRAAEPRVLNLWRGLPGEIAQELSRG